MYLQPFTQILVVIIISVAPSSQFSTSQFLQSNSSTSQFPQSEYSSTIQIPQSEYSSIIQIPQSEYSSTCQLLQSKYCSCTGGGNVVDCGNKNINGVKLKQVFDKVKNPSSFERLSIRGTVLEEVLDHSFDPVSFGTIVISDNKYLEGVRREAFAGSESSVRSLQLNKNALSGSSVFRSFIPLKQLREINLSNNRLKSIPSLALDGFDHLVSVSLSENQIKVMSPLSFTSLPSVTRIDLSFNGLERIESRSFHQIGDDGKKIGDDGKKIGDDGKKIGDDGKKNPFDDFKTELLLSLRGNNVKEFKLNSFVQVNRPVRLDLSLNQITFLDRRIFHPLLSNHGIIDVKGIKNMTCGCESFWILPYLREDSGSGKVKNVPDQKVKNYHCSDQESIQLQNVALDHFAHCEKITAD